MACGARRIGIKVARLLERVFETGGAMNRRHGIAPEW
jgi:hypothetical protein